MPVNLTKGQKVSLTKGNPGLSKVVVGLGWDVNQFDTGEDFDLDATAFMLTDTGKCPSDKEFIFFGNLAHPSGAVDIREIILPVLVRAMMSRSRLIYPKCRKILQGLRLR